MYSKEDKNIGQIYQQLLAERRGMNASATFWVNRWISREMKNKFLATNQPLFPQDQIFSDEKKVQGEPEECPDIEIDVEGQLSYEKPTYETPGGWWMDDMDDATVTEDIPIYDDDGNPVQGRFLYKRGTKIELSKRESDYALDKMIENFR